MVSRVIPVESFDLVIFGATGDLAKRKIFPGLFRRFLAGQMPTDSQVVGAARSNLSQKKFNDLVENSIKSFAEIKFKEQVITNIFLTVLLIGFIISLISTRPYIKSVTNEIKFTHVAKKY